MEFLHLIVKKFVGWLVASQIAWMNGGAAGAVTDNQIITVVVLDVLIVYVLLPLITKNKSKRVETIVIGLVVWIVLRMTFEMLGGAK